MNTPRGRIGITLTGADERTPIADLVRLADLGAEIGFLYTQSPAGRNRYPSLGWIGEVAAALGDRAALHVCGHRARAAFSDGRLDNLLQLFGRVQVNGLVSPEALGHWLSTVVPQDVTLITQHTPGNAGLLGACACDDSVRHAVLVDASGGRGRLPESWQRPETDKPVGFAGGLGPSTLRKELPKIAVAARGDWWVDMESRLRDADDWFSVERALEALNVFRMWKKSLPSDGLADRAGR